MTDADRNRKVANALLGNTQHFSTDDFNKLWAEVLQQRDENIERQRLLEEDRAKMLAHIDSREKELANQLSKMRSDFARREAELEAHLSKRQESLEAEERAIRQRSDEMIEAAERRMREARSRQHSLEAELKKFAEDKKRYDAENNQKLQTISSEFVGGVISDLKKRESSLSRTSFWWAVVGGMVLAGGLGFAGFSIYQTSTMITISIPWQILVYQATKGVLFIAIGAFLARYAFLLSRRYLDESLRVSNIVHDVSFGQLYVQSYGATAGWDQVKEAFSKWHHPDGQKADAAETSLSNDWGISLPDVTRLLDTIKSIKLGSGDGSTE